MSLTLGEKLREAREERGFTLSEVAEQTRISSLYLESIENDDYRTLPGGIFNKGFVKSYAKFVGLNEQEALLDYSAILAGSEAAEQPELKLYKPEVLTDDRSRSSMVPTVITAVVILGLMTAGILFLVNYFRQPGEPAAVNSAQKANTSPPAANASPEAPSNVPAMATLKVEFKALGQPVRLIATSDGAKSDNVVAAGASATFEPKESLTLNYNRWNATAVQMTINGKSITLPATPLSPVTDKGRIEFTISKDNLAQIWTSGAISTEVPGAASDSNANVAAPVGGPTPATTAPTQPKASPSAPPANKPTTNANAAAKPTPDSKPAKTPAPATPKPAANNEP